MARKKKRLLALEKGAKRDERKTMLETDPCKEEKTSVEKKLRAAKERQRRRFKGRGLPKEGRAAL